ncbi:hypothetical protein [Nibricoccus sp. IMCC34717]|uniref:hypothetical protein n=1 Tax=Nibricoccus sp. IMCC34717 TaxID=3034021 RepID=UPI00384F8F44
MTPRTARLVLVLLLAVLAFGVTSVIRRRVQAGEVYPQYSSLRADTFGLRALHDTLASLPGLTVERWLRPLEKVPAQGGTTYVLAGVSRAWWEALDNRAANAIEQSLQAGDRWVLCFRAELTASEPTPVPAPGLKAAKAKDSKPEPTPTPSPTPLPRSGVQRESSSVAALQAADWKRRWGIEVAPHKTLTLNDEAVVAPDLANTLPRSLRWQSDLVFTVSSGAEVRTLYRRFGEPAMIELKRGRGTILLCGESYLLSNERLSVDAQPTLLSRMLGPHPRFVFIESHLGVMEDPGMAALARRYGLGVGLFLSLVAAALAIWRTATPFVPPAPAAAAVPLHYSPTAGLRALLRRSLTPAELFDHCLHRWRETASPAEKARLAAASTAEAPKADDQHYNSLSKKLHPRRNP